MMLYYFVEFAGSFANIALLLLFIGRLFPKKEPVSRWFYASYVALLIAGQCALSLFPDWVTQRTIYLLVGGFLLALLFYEVRPWQAVFASGAFFTLAALVEVLAMLLIGLRIPDTEYRHSDAGWGSTVGLYCFFKPDSNSTRSSDFTFFQPKGKCSAHPMAVADHCDSNRKYRGLLCGTVSCCG